MERSIKVLFSDIGGVLLTNGWPHESRQAAAKLFGFDYEAMNELHEEAFPEWEAGNMSMSDYLDKILFFEPRSFTKEAFTDFMYRQSVALPRMLPWLLEWKKRNPQIKICSLNNEPKELHEYRVKAFGLADLFDQFVTSCYVHSRKPDARIYNAALAAADVAKEDSFYIDDRADLIAAATTLGFRAMVHTQFEETSEVLESIVRS